MTDPSALDKFETFIAGGGPTPPPPPDPTATQLQPFAQPEPFATLPPPPPPPEPFATLPPPPPPPEPFAPQPQPLLSPDQVATLALPPPPPPPGPFALPPDPFVAPLSPSPASSLAASNVSAWFGAHKVLDRVSLTMEAGRVTALIGPSGCGKSTFLRILNRMHELVATAALAGVVALDGNDIYRGGLAVTEIRRRIGMVFQKPNPFPTMSISENVVSGLRLSGLKRKRPNPEIVEDCLTRAGLWNEVKNRLGAAGGSLSGGQQQRLCIARALAVEPNVLLMDEPCSALDPTSTRRIEETIAEISERVTIVIVTHNMQQAQRVSHHCAFFLASEHKPGHIVEHGPTEKIFAEPDDPRTLDYVRGRFG